MDQVKIGKFIAELRKEKNMTQVQLAEKLDITDRAVSKWENGRGLPEVSLMKPLCEILGITLSELLDGERSDKNLQDSNLGRNVLEVLRDREREILKREYLQKACAVLMAIIIIFTSIFGFRVAVMAFSGLRGDGYSIGCFFNTQKANKTVELILKHKYEKAAENIGFYGASDKEKARSEWAENMKALYDEIYIEELEITKITLDDYFPKADFYMVVYDKETQVNYLLNGILMIQDGGIAFGGIYIPYVDSQSRRTEIAYMIENAISTYYPG